MTYRSLAHLFGGEFQEAASWARRATQVPNAHYLANANLVSALGHLGDRRQAEEAISALLRMRPDFTRRFAAERLFYVKNPNQLRKNPDQLKIFLEGLRRAGIP
jgi:Flp pilus assembly protein TadD